MRSTGLSSRCPLSQTPRHNGTFLGTRRKRKQIRPIIFSLLISIFCLHLFLSSVADLRNGPAWPCVALPCLTYNNFAVLPTRETQLGLDDGYRLIVLLPLPHPQPQLPKCQYFQSNTNTTISSASRCNHSSHCLVPCLSQRDKCK